MRTKLRGRKKMLALKVLNGEKVGPRGGNLNNPKQYPEARRSGFNGEITELHRFEKDHDSALCGIQNEQPWHRMAAYMLLAGRTNSEIAMAAGVVPTTVSLLRAQRWFQQLLATIANKAGDEIIGILQSEAAASVQKLVELRDCAESERVQLSAAQTLVEQAHGKPTQKILSHSSHTSYQSPKEELDEIQRELAALRALPT
jgi:hypothetical protein